MRDDKSELSMDGADVSTGPLVVDTHELGRRPGTERTLERSVEAPAGLGSDVYGVPEGSPIDIELRLEAVMDGVLATGTTSVQVTGECVRCLIEIDDDLDVEPVLRDAVVLALPLNPVCDPECPGLCPECGARLADDPDHTHEAAIDPRWSALKELKE
jgi:uncharacterized protein